jgi:hypothetical protein
MASIHKVDERITLYLTSYGDVEWHGWLYKFHTGRTAKERDLRAYRPRTLVPVPGVPGRWQDSGRQDAYVADTGRKGDAKWAVVLYEDQVATTRTKGEAQHALRDLLGLGR